MAQQTNRRYKIGGSETHPTNIKFRMKRRGHFAWQKKKEEVHKVRQTSIVYLPVPSPMILLPPVRVHSRDSTRAREAVLGSLLPEQMALSLSPVPRRLITFEVPISVAIPILQKTKERVPEGRVHPHALSRMVAADTVARQALFEQRLVVGTATVQMAGWRHPWGIGPPLTTRVMPSAQSVSGAVQGAV